MTSRISMPPPARPKSKTLEELVAAPELQANLALNRCPHCGIDHPNLSLTHNKWPTHDMAGKDLRYWGCYFCRRCGGVLIAASKSESGAVTEVYPEPATVDADLPPRAAKFLQQAIDTVNSPSASIMVAASAVDAMLKEKKLVSGSLYSRIEAAVKQKIITPDVAGWAHDVRLDANDERHVDEQAVEPSGDDAKRVIDFVAALGQIMFVLPARVRRGRASAQPGASGGG